MRRVQASRIRIIGAALLGALLLGIYLERPSNDARELPALPERDATAPESMPAPRRAAGAAPPVAAEPAPVRSDRALGRRIIGRIAADDGAPIAGASIAALGVPKTNASERALFDVRDELTPSVLAATATRAPDGSYAIDGLESGSHRVVVRHAEHATLVTRVVDLGPAWDATVSCDAQLERAQSLTMIVLDRDRRAIAGAEVSLSFFAKDDPSEMHPFVVALRAGSGGTCTLPGVPQEPDSSLIGGPFTHAHVRHDGFVEAHDRRLGDNERDSAGRALIMLDDAAVLTLRFLTPRGEPLTAPLGFVARFRRDTPPMRGAADIEGHARLPHAPLAGEVRIRLESDEWCIDVGDDATRDPSKLDWFPIATSADPAVIVRLCRGAVVEGRAIDAASGAGIPALEITCTAARRSVVTDQGGGFRFEGLQPGWAPLTSGTNAWSVDVERLRRDYPETNPFTRGFPGWKSKDADGRIEISTSPPALRVFATAARGMGGLEVPFLKAGSIAGRVLAPGGAPLEGARVRLYWEDSALTFSSRAHAVRRGEPLPGDVVTTDATGVYRLASIPAGPWRVRAEHASYAPAETPDSVTLGSGEHRAGVDIRMPPLTPFDLRLVDEAGRGLAGVEVRAHLPPIRKALVARAAETAFTDAEGYARFTRIAAPILINLRPANLEGLGYVWPAGTPYEYEVPKNEPRVRTVAVARARSIRGRVLEISGKPVAGAWIAAERVLADGSTERLPVLEVRTAGDGSFVAHAGNDDIHRIVTVGVQRPRDPLTGELTGTPAGTGFQSLVLRCEIVAGNEIIPDGPEAVVTVRF
jgi:protocatechuate 3,4-dioxygenase beta subunit